MIVSDNGSCFTSSELKTFCEMNGIRHVTTAPYHPASNGLAERAVQTVKQGVKRMRDGNLQDKVSRFLFKYRITPQTTTGDTPSQLLMGRSLRSRMDLIHPNLYQRVQAKQEQQKRQHDKSSVNRSFDLGDKVFAKNFAIRGQKWLIGHIVKKTGPISFKVKLENGNVVRRHQDQIRKCHLSNSANPLPPKDTNIQPPSIIEIDAHDLPVADNSDSDTEPPQAVGDVAEAYDVESNASDVPDLDYTPKSYPKRNRKRPDYYRP
ncbi:hypothetical protein BSL78_06599 [Apostichopus japonicus]|uniref:Integrase catalytic domain-containing protein n=1 Tax=Stichopus japonicus TaxID=307972 RepID=A0A2G8L8A5_STIJA|nr:hypothetical protein BSL78_06599 [Apostichopus japonicus]